MLSSAHGSFHRPVLSSPYTAVLIFGAATFIPYLVAKNNSIFILDRIIDPWLHAVIALFLVAVALFATHAGYRHTGRIDKAAPRNFIAPGVSSDLVSRLAQIGLWFSVAISVIVGLHTFNIYRGGNFLAARAALEFQGIGVLARLYIAAVPLYLAATGRLSREIKVACALLFISIALRALAISERSSLIEFLIVMSVAYQGVSRRSLAKYAPYALAFLPVYMGFVLQDRLRTQGHAVDSNLIRSTLFELNTTMIYYADTVNKFYAGLFEGLTAPAFFFLDPIYKLFGAGTRTDIALQNRDVLLLMGRLGITNTGLSNPGGMSQDFSDFAFAFVPVYIAKFYVFGSLARSFFSKNPIGLCLYPLCFVAVIEYARFNYFNNGYGFLLGFIFLASAIYISSIKTRGEFSESQSIKATNTPQTNRPND